ncbi:MAG: right-handed parallel beta-helix repeat-containing protein [Ruminococcaceae bacterium]|nr:right-handed parallel beta-helix repeat-containing protein [Oscillospiraceae bacterium]
MTNKKTTKRALLFSVLSMLLCVTMLMGTTYAWFTDSVSSTNNIIKSGNLDVELYYSKDGSTWTEVNSQTNVFAESLWEPGYTEVVYLKVKNAGSLALKYQLGVNVASEIGSKNVLGDEFKLSDFIKYGVTTEAIANREDAIAKVDATATRLNLAYNTNGSLLTGEEAVMTMVVYMPETVGNEANHAKDAAVPTINLGLNLFATQYTYEEDSFGNDYDETAAFSVWNGVVPTEMPETLVVDGAAQTVYVKDAAAFAYLSTLSAKWVDLYTDGNGTTYTNYANGAGANYYYSGKWTVSLEADIDLANHELAPVVIMFGQAAGATKFDGNGHTIRNIKAEPGLFADGTRASYSNLVLMNVTATRGALTGVSNHSIDRVTVKNASISGTDYVGGLVGSAYSTVTNCVVEDSFVVATGKEAGGLIGYAEANSKGSEITNNIVRNVSVYAGNRAAGLVAQPNVNIKVYKNVIDTVTVGAEDLSKYACGAVVSNALAPANVYDNTVKNATVETAKIAIVSGNTDLKDAVNDDDVKKIVLAAGTYTLPTLANKDGITIEGSGSTVVGGDSATTGFGSNFGKNTVIKNVTFSGATNGVRYSYAKGGTTVFENCTFAGDSTYGFHIDASGNATFIFNDCTFVGFNAFAGDLESITFNNCTFLSNGNYGHTNIWSVGYFNNCTWGENATYGIRGSGVIYIDGVKQ